MSALHSSRDDLVACAQASLSTKQIKMLLEVDHGVPKSLFSIFITLPMHSLWEANCVHLA